MSSEGSVTRWIDRLRAGDPEAAQRLWERYFQQLVGLARRKFQGTILHIADEQDVAASAFESFWQGIQGGRFPHLHDRDNLWGLLITITTRKAMHYFQYDQRKRRRAQSAEQDADEVMGREPSPEVAAQMSEEFQHLLDRLGDPILRSIALWRMEGFSNKEIAEKLSQVRRTHERTVERKLERIRAIWSQEIGR
jgi:RNA polymerase sigma factor (sigma-70 family)